MTIDDVRNVVSCIRVCDVNAGGALTPSSTANLTGTLTIDGNLVLQTGALYLVQLTPTTSSSTAVKGAATLGGATVNAIFANGAYVSKQYTILTASAGVSGTFGSLVNTNLPSGFKTALSYVANSVVLSLSLDFVPPSDPGPGSPGFVPREISRRSALPSEISSTPTAAFRSCSDRSRRQG